AEGSTFKMSTGNVTLFARWTQNDTFTVTYNGNTNTSGAVPTDPGKYKTGATVTVKSNSGNLVKAGFTFVGWEPVPTEPKCTKGRKLSKLVQTMLPY
ncbi:MAG TPA: InlB B-repeat-containing protein, partial [Chitinispirillaceae bacterium]|nr:InlB B-repeat-containing protein [Chitinispirillaceae bacterium]